MGRYDVFTWWGEKVGWKRRFRNVRWWRQLGQRMTQLRGEGWCELSVLITRRNQ
jgi:hypothetical protein